MSPTKIRTIEKPCDKCDATGKFVRTTGFVVFAAGMIVFAFIGALAAGWSLSTALIWSGFAFLVVALVCNAKKCTICGGTGRQTVRETITDE